MSLTIVRMNTASSHTSTVLLTLPPLSDDLLNYRLDVEHHHPPSLYLNRTRHRAHHRNLGSIGRAELVDRDVLNVAHIVDADSRPAVEVIHQQNQPFGAAVRPLAERSTAIDHRDDGAPQIDEPANGFGRAGQPRQMLRRYDLAKRIHVAGIRPAADVENEEPPRWNVRLFIRCLLVGRRWGRYRVTHRSEVRSGRPRCPGAHALRRRPREHGEGRSAGASENPAPFPSRDD